MGKISFFGAVLFFAANVVASPSIIISQPPEGMSFEYTLEVSNPTSDGKYIAFIAAGDVDGNASPVQVYLRDLSTGITTLVSKNIEGVPANSASHSVQLSADGSALSFISSATNLSNNSDALRQLFIYQVESGVLSVVNGTDDSSLDEDIDEYVLSRSSERILFTTSASNVITSGNPNSKALYQYNLATQTSEFVYDTFSPTLLDSSVDGKRALFKVYGPCSGLILVNTEDGALENIPIPEESERTCQRPADARLSDDGKFVFFKVAYYQSYRFIERKAVVYSLDEESFHILNLPFYLSVGSALGIASENDAVIFKGGVNFLGTEHLWLYELDEGNLQLVNVGVDNGAAGLPSAEKIHFTLSAPEIAFVGRQDGHEQALLVDVNNIETNAPNVIEGASASTSELSKIVLNWASPVEIPSFYMVYRKLTGLTGKGDFVGYTTTNTFTDIRSGLDEAETYTFTVDSCNSLFQCNGISVEGGKLLGPDKVEGLYLADGSENALREIQWDGLEPSSDAESILYEVLVNYNFNSRTAMTSLLRYRWRDYEFGSQVLWMQVRACIEEVCGEYTDPVRVEPAPSQAITNLRYTVNQDFTNLVLQWDATEYASHYRVYSESQLNNELTFRQKVTLPEFTDVLVTLAEGERYAVKACDAFDNCGSQHSIQVFPISQNTISNQSPPSLYIEMKSDHYQFRSNSTVYETYSLYRRTDQFGTGHLVTTEEVGIGGVFQFSDTEIQPETQYYYYLEGCINQFCHRSRDVMASPISTYEQAIAKISDLSASFNTYKNLIRLSWSVDEPADGVEIYRDSNRIAIMNGKVEQFDDNSITQGQHHSYYVVPFLQSSISSYQRKMGQKSNIAIGSTDYEYGTAIIPSAPTLYASSGLYYDKIEVHWNNVENVQKYELYISDSLNGDYTFFKTLYGTSTTINLLAPGSSIFFKAISCNKGFCSDFSEAVEGVTSNALSPPSAEASISQLTLTANNDVLVEYSAISDAAYYEVLRKTAMFSPSETKFIAPDIQYLDESVEPDKDYYYRVKACNPAGCSAVSDFVHVKTGFDPSSDTLVAYKIKETTSTVSRIRVEYDKKNSGNTSPSKLNFYYATSADGEKTLLQSITNFDARFVDFEDADTGVSYFLWLENCYEQEEGETCLLDERYWVNKLEVDSPMPVIPLPQLSDIEAGPGKIYLSKSVWVPYGASVNFYISETPDGSKQQVGAVYSHYSPRDFDVSSLAYKERPIWLTAQQCNDDACSAHTSPLQLKMKPYHTNEMVFNEKNWQGLSKPTFYQNRLAYLLHGTEISRQFLYVGSGFSSSFNLYVPSGTQAYQTCTPYFSFSPYSGDSSLSLPSFISIYRGSSACIDLGFTDSEKFYVVIGEDIESAYTFDAESFADSWNQFSFTMNENFDAVLSINNKIIAEYTYEKMAHLNMEFVELRFASDLQNDYVRLHEFSGNSIVDFERNRPNLSYFRAYASGNLIKMNWSADDATETIRLHKYTLTENGLDEPRIYNFSPDKNVNLGLFYTGEFLLQAYACKGDICSRARYDSAVVEKFSYLEPPSAPVLQQKGKSRDVGIEIAAVEGATFYKVYASDSSYKYGSQLKATTTSLSTTLVGISHKQLYVWVMACNDDICSDYSAYSKLSLTFDSDNDGLTDEVEYQLGTDPYRSDTDGDGLSDYDEVMTHNTNPLSTDTDGDGISDDIEIAQGLDPLSNQACPAYLCGSKYKGWRLGILAGADKD